MKISCYFDWPAFISHIAFLAALKNCSLFCTVSVLIVWHGEFLFWFFLFGVLYTSCILIGIFPLKFDKFILWFYWKYFLCFWPRFLLLLWSWFIGLVSTMLQSFCVFYPGIFRCNIFFDQVIQFVYLIQTWYSYSHLIHSIEEVFHRIYLTYWIFQVTEPYLYLILLPYLELFALFHSNICVFCRLHFINYLYPLWVT